MPGANLMIRTPVLAASALALSVLVVPRPAMAEHHEPAIPAGPALWQLSDEDTTIYLFGTIHLLPEGEVWFDDRIRNAFDEADELVFELSISDMDRARQAMAELAMLPPETTLRSLMAEDDLAQYEAALGDIGIPTDALDPFEPWVAAVTLALLPLQMAGWTPDLGVEMQLRAMGDGKPYGALETIEEQLALFDTMPMDVQLDYLDLTIESIPEIVPGLDALKAEWLAGDAEALGSLINEGMEDPEIHERLLINRNRNWAGWLANRLDTPGTVFVAVGAGHLAGEGSVQEQLAQRGLEVERVTR